MADLKRTIIAEQMDESPTVPELNRAMKRIIKSRDNKLQKYADATGVQYGETRIKKMAVEATRLPGRKTIEVRVEFETDIIDQAGAA